MNCIGDPEYEAFLDQIRCDLNVTSFNQASYCFSSDDPSAICKDVVRVCNG